MVRSYSTIFRLSALAVFVMVALAITLLWPDSGPPSANDGPTLRGDANCSNDITIGDATTILAFLAGSIGSLPCPENADANCDEVVDVDDANLIVAFLAGFTDVPPGCTPIGVAQRQHCTRHDARSGIEHVTRGTPQPETVRETVLCLRNLRPVVGR